MAAALVLLAGAVGAGLGWVVASRQAASQVAAPNQLVSSDGVLVGSVRSAVYDRERVGVVQLDGSASAGTYTCRVLRADGTSVDVGTWAWDGSRTALWIVPLPTDAATMQVVNQRGMVWATGSL